MKRSRFVAFLLALIMVLGSAAMAVGSKTEISIYPGVNLSVNGQNVKPVNERGEEVELFLYNDSTYAPIRYLAQLLGLDVDWDGKSSTVQLEGKVNLDAVKGDYIPGTYTGTAMGFGGPVTATVTVTADAITAARVTGDKETDDIGAVALNRLGYLARTQGLEMDGVTGATYTSRGARDALGVALAKAQGKTFGVPADGKYTKVVIGHEGTINVSTVVVGGKIKLVTINAQDETEGVGTYAVDHIPGRILAAQSVNVDSVGGASVSSATIKQAVTEGLIAAGADITNWITAPEKPEIVPTQRTENVDVVIAGAGTAGLMAAVRLLEAGVENVVLFEKQEIPGGSMATAFGGFNGTDSQIYENWRAGRDDKLNLYMSKWENISGNLAAVYGLPKDAEMPWLEQMYKEAGYLYDWLTSIGVGFNSLGVEPGLAGSPYFAPGCYSGGCGYFMEFIVDRIEAKGGRIIYNTEVTELIRNGTGSVTGVKAVGEDGTTWTVNAKDVMLATGSFAKNEEMLRQYHPEWADYYFNCPETLTGDGLRMGLEAGGHVIQAGEYMPGFLSTYNSHYELAFIHMMNCGLMVNIKGDEFANITKNNHATMAAAKADPANGDTFYYVFDEAGAATIRDYDAKGMSYKAVFEKEEAIHYDTVAEASKALDLPNLAATIEKNNACYLAGEANQWGLGMTGTYRLPYIDTTDGVWLMRVDPNPYLTVAGLDCDIDGHILTAEGRIIDGLWGAGDVIGAYETREGFYGNGFDAAVTFGAIVGDRIAEKQGK